MDKIVIISSRARSLVNFRGALLQAWQALGLEVHAVCPRADENAPAVSRLKDWGVEVHYVDMNRTGTHLFHDALLWGQLLFLLIKLKPSYLFAYTIKPVIYGLTSAWVAGVPHRFAMITGLGHAFETSDSWLRVMVSKMYFFAVRCSERIFFQNNDDLELFSLRGLLGDAERALVVNGSGVDLDWYSEAPLPEQCIRFIFIGRLLRAKGVREFAQASAILLADYPQVKFTIVGWVDDNPDSIGKAEIDRWMADGVEFLGQLEDVRPALMQASVLVLPSYREGTPRTVLEAMSMGRPIITTDAPGCRETVEPGVNGILVEPRSTSSLVSAMTYLINNPGRLEAMGRASRRIAEQKYDVRKVTATVLAGMGLLGSAT